MSQPDAPRIDQLQQAESATDEIEQMIQLQRRMERECEASGGHERVATKDTSFGWHEGHCSKCGKDMSYDSSG